MGELDNAPIPPMGADDMGGEDPMGGTPDDMGGGEPPMGGEDPMGGDMPQDPSMGGGDDDELMNIVNDMSTEDKAAVIKYAKSIVDDSEGGAPQDGGMPMESVRNYKGIIDEVINDVLDGQEGTKRPSKKIAKEYEEMKSPWKSPY
jgi:hypothetical protein